MRIPRGKAHQALRTVVRRRSSERTFRRPTQGSTGRFGDNDGSTTPVQGVDTWLFEPTEVNLDTEFGDRLQGDLQGLALPSADVEVQDRVSHGPDEYEVQQIYHLPDNDRKELKLIELQKRTNDPPDSVSP